MNCSSFVLACYFIDHMACVRPVPHPSRLACVRPVPRAILTDPTLPYLSLHCPNNCACVAGAGDHADEVPETADIEEKLTREIKELELRLAQARAAKAAPEEIAPAPSASVRIAPGSASASGHLCQVIGLCQANMDEHADVT